MSDSEFDSGEDATEHTSLLMTSVAMTDQPNGAAVGQWESPRNGNVQPGDDSSTVRGFSGAIRAL
jgi:hypothetical protein